MTPTPRSQAPRVAAPHLRIGRAGGSPWRPAGSWRRNAASASSRSGRRRRGPTDPPVRRRPARPRAAPGAGDRPRRGRRVRRQAHVYPEDLLIPFPALRRAGRSVDRGPNRALAGLVHAREQAHEVTLGFATRAACPPARPLRARHGRLPRAASPCPSSPPPGSTGPYRIPTSSRGSRAATRNECPGRPIAARARPRPSSRANASWTWWRASRDATGRSCGAGTCAGGGHAAGHGAAELSRQRPVILDSGDLPSALAAASSQLASRAVRGGGRRARAGRLRARRRLLPEVSGAGPFEGASVRVDASGRVTAGAARRRRARAPRRCWPRSSPTSWGSRRRTSRGSRGTAASSSARDLREPRRRGGGHAVALARSRCGTRRGSSPGASSVAEADLERPARG